MDHRTARASDAIREQTKEHHQSLEKKVVSILKQINDYRDYARMLSCFFAFFERIEDKLAAFITDDILPGFGQRRKSGWIMNDIKQLDAGVVIPAVTRLPVISDQVQAMSALYVLEGSTLGGTTIAAMLKKKGFDRGLSFFESYGADVMMHWKVFLDAFNVIVAPHQFDHAVSSAASTFDAFHVLFGEVYPVQESR